MIWLGIGLSVLIVAVAVAFILASLKISSRLTEMSEKVDNLYVPSIPNSVATSIPKVETIKDYVVTTPQMVVQEWATEQESMGLVVDPQVVTDQIKMWEQNEEYL
jgi:hypothetical protein